MHEPVRHVVVDANILGAYFCPASTDSLNVQKRASVILNSGLKAAWTSLRLYSPGICIAEARGILDKYQLCTWHGPLKRRPRARLTPTAYKKAQQELAIAVQSRRIQQIEHEPAHVLLAGLVSPVNSHYQIRRRRASARNIKSPMGAADCLIAGMAILLGQRLGRDNVVLVTDDQRMCDVMLKCRGLNQTQAAQLGLTAVAKESGMSWTPALYVPCINLRTARLADLRDALLGWPLPQKRVRDKDRTSLTSGEKRNLGQLWLQVSWRSGITNPDRLPYTPVIDDLRTRFAVATGTHLSNGAIFRELLALRKATKWPFEKKTKQTKQ